MPAPLSTKEDVVAALLTVIRREGYDGASLSVLSEATGLGKSSLYHYFPDGKDDMVEAALEYVAARMEATVFAALRGDAAPRARIQSMARALDAFYRGGREPCLLAALGFGESAGRFHPRVSQLFTEWIAAITGVLRDAGVPAGKARARAEEALARIEGALVLARSLDKPAIFARTLKALPDGLLAS
ncbi:MAG: TetR/AcrR family transcriptional regulator [Gemmatimonadaceae bacterium]